MPQTPMHLLYIPPFYHARRLYPPFSCPGPASLHLSSFYLILSSHCLGSLPGNHLSTASRAAHRIRPRAIPHSSHASWGLTAAARRYYPHGSREVMWDTRTVASSRGGAHNCAKHTTSGMFSSPFSNGDLNATFQYFQHTHSHHSPSPSSTPTHPHPQTSSLTSATLPQPPSSFPFRSLARTSAISSSKSFSAGLGPSKWVIEYSST